MITFLFVFKVMSYHLSVDLIYITNCIDKIYKYYTKVVHQIIDILIQVNMMRLSHPNPNPNLKQIQNKS